MNIIGPLTDPRAHGGNPEDAFHVVIPSLPGFGFSGPTTEVGWNISRVVKTWAELMRRLGYERYGAQGGDTGSLVSPELGRFVPDCVIGVHVNGLATFPSGDPAESIDLSEIEQARFDTLTEQSYETGGYAIIQSTRPQTLAYGLTDSPVGQLAWIVEKFKEWTDPAANLPEEAVDLDHLLTNVTLYWLTGTAGSSARIYKEEAKFGVYLLSALRFLLALRFFLKTYRSEELSNESITSCTGQSSIAEVTLRQWKYLIY